MTRADFWEAVRIATPILVLELRIHHSRAATRARRQADHLKLLVLMQARAAAHVIAKLAS